MSVRKRLEAIHSIIKDDGGGDVVIAELKSLAGSVSHPYQKEKIQTALEWAKIYYARSGRSDVEQTKANLLQSVYKASIARREKDDLH
jgi:hypothetical protein